MKRIILTALLAALMVLPATALARHGHSRGIHRSHGQVGTITSFDSATGELVITTTKGRELSALVTEDTHLQCKSDDDEDTATTSRHGDDDGPNHDAGDDNGDDNDNEADDDNNEAGDDDNNGHHGHHSSKCSTDDLVAGAVVRRARIDLSGEDAVWTKLKLAS
ncbi:MAG: hypothetical protein QOI80_1885 [Solirubrobacteraceae bacterium]|jgi:hypothetical protein|nr:hypothetical protein [Solirubrobacteraceae bacterium]